MKLLLIRLIIIPFVIVLASCANMNTIITAHAKSGISRNFNNDHELVKAAVIASVQSLNINIKESGQTPDGFYILFTKSISFPSWGEIGRVLVTKVDDNNTLVFVHSAKRDLTQSTLYGMDEQDFAKVIFEGVTEILERRGEILGLKWEQVDLRHSFILLDTSKNGERREIPINTTLEYLFKEMPHSVESVFVFAGKKGKPLTDIKKSFHVALKNAGILDFRFHDLRHTFASHLVMAGVDLTSVKELLGHKDIKMTLRYSHLAPGHKRKAVQVLDRIMDKNEDVNLYNGHNLGTMSKQSQHRECPKPFVSMVGATGFEPATS